MHSLAVSQKTAYDGLYYKRFSDITHVNQIIPDINNAYEDDYITICYLQHLSSPSKAEALHSSRVVLGLVRLS